MAAFYLHIEKQKSISEALFHVFRSINDDRKVERNAAILIQSWFRSLRVRRYIRHLHCCAVIIQKSYRAYASRKLYRKLVQQKMVVLRKIYYDTMAIKIQARWRGYYVRKFKFNFYARKRYLEGVVKKNGILRSELQKRKEKQELEEHLKFAEDELMKEAYLNRKTHHLISTHVCRGVYNSPTKPNFEKEYALRISNPFSKSERALLEETKKAAALNCVTGIPQADQICDRAGNEYTLPPLKEHKPQGPFRKPEEVIKQRYKKLQPTLRVATDFESVEKARFLLRQDEWTKRVIDKSFLPSTRTNYTYQPALHSTSEYGRLDYGTKHFRDVHKDKELHHQPFQRVVSSIELFDQLGKTY